MQPYKQTFFSHHIFIRINHTALILYSLIMCFIPCKCKDLLLLFLVFFDKLNIVSANCAGLNVTKERRD